MSINIDDKEIYGFVANEMANNIMDTGLMAKALADTDFDENRSKALYMKMRVADLISQNKQQEKLLKQQSLEANKQKQHNEMLYKKDLASQEKEIKKSELIQFSFLGMVFFITGLFALVIFVAWILN